MSDTFTFAPESPKEPTNGIDTVDRRKWKVAVIDDDHGVHSVTRMALSKFEFEGHPVEFIQGFSGADAKTIFQEHSDIAVVLLDVVMETDHSGLDVVKFIRDDLGNRKTRIVLRTGQPGQAPERQVIAQYDINDYKEKTELTARKLFTLMYSCLRSYRDIVALDESRIGLERVINASKNVFTNQFLDEFAHGVLQQIASVLYADKDAFFGHMSGLAAQEEEGAFRIVAGTGRYHDMVGENALAHLPDDLAQHLVQGESGGLRKDDSYLSVAKSHDGTTNVLFLTGVRQDTELDRHLMDLFSQNVLVAFDNLYLRDQVMETQREVVYRLGEAVESRSKETGNHVKRVAEISKVLALAHGMDPQEAEILKHASPLHDVGKIGIPDAILNKPGSFEAEEWEVMKSHAEIGYEMLAGSKREILKTGAMISLQHHEKWDGSGYPNGLRGEEISLEARITAIADVYDALASDRCYKKAWPLQEVEKMMQEQSGRQFDPKLIDLLFENLEKVNAIRDRFVDEFSDG